MDAALEVRFRHILENEGWIPKPTAHVLESNNLPQEIEAEGLLSTCIQHEIDHLDGRLFVDHISMLKRNIILRKMTKLKKLGR